MPPLNNTQKWACYGFILGAILGGSAQLIHYLMEYNNSSSLTLNLLALISVTGTTAQSVDMAMTFFEYLALGTFCGAVHGYNKAPANQNDQAANETTAANL